MKTGPITRTTIALLLLATGLGASAEERLGTIAFPNSGDEAAQEAFLRGVAALHSFEFDPAPSRKRRRSIPISHSPTGARR